MTRTEATQVLALLTAAYPRAEMPDPTVEVWISNLVRLDYRRTYQAVELLVGESMFVPTIAEVRKRYDDLTRRETQERLRDRALPEESETPLPTKGRQLANVRRAREILGRVGRKVPDDGPYEGTER